MAFTALRPIGGMRCLALRTPLAAARPALSASRPAQLQSSFLGTPTLGGLCSSLRGLALVSQRRAPEPLRRQVKTEANSKTSMACKFRGSRRARARTSGYRARMATPAGRKVLAARKKRGRHVLCPAHLKKPNGKN
ncbi:hypothetical protein WJX81_004154 [Elliptochloris bilobata]|uniref:50S ribosomal protein L34 n=1 Tax=Elliptochloris bilobata TaxID=381761 RepID=A0AAW1RDM2_9CHLO